MPNCFQLIGKETGKPTAFVAIDEALCGHFGYEIHPTKYLFGWYDAIGFRVACGKSLDDIRKEFAGYVSEALGKNELGDVEYYDRLVRVVDYLKERYTTDAWAEVGRK
jgi:hypothetical protein